MADVWDGGGEGGGGVEVLRKAESLRYLVCKNYLSLPRPPYLNVKISQRSHKKLQARGKHFINNVAGGVRVLLEKFTLFTAVLLITTIKVPVIHWELN